MQVIPAIDLLESKAVRLHQGRYDHVTVYADDPTLLAAEWRLLTDRLHVVDLEGARAGRAVQADVVRRLITAFAPGLIQVGGGVRSLTTVESYFELGVARVVLGSAALDDPALVREAARRFPGRIVLAVDARKGCVATAGWLEQSERRAVDVVKSFADVELAAVLYTDIDRDGTEVGPNIEQTSELAGQISPPVIASGGVGTLDHLRSLSVAHRNIEAAVVGRALLERRFSLTEARDVLDAQRASPN